LMKIFTIDLKKISMNAKITIKNKNKIRNFINL
jgi:hypothetical protein